MGSFQTHYYLLPLSDQQSPTPAHLIFTQPTLAIEEKGGWQTRYLLAHSTICHLQICQEELRYHLDQSHHQVEDDDDNANNDHQG